MVISGIIQAIGFRPFINKEARKRALIGWVRNVKDSVDMVVQGEAQIVRDFILALDSSPIRPFLGRYNKLTLEPDHLTRQYREDRDKGCVIIAFQDHNDKPPSNPRPFHANGHTLSLVREVTTQTEWHGNKPVTPPEVSGREEMYNITLAALDSIPDLDARLVPPADDLAELGNFYMARSPQELGYFRVSYIPPDTRLCAPCEADTLQAGRNPRRYHYPYVVCAECGPRYTIIRTTPYDRDKTNMGADAKAGKAFDRVNPSSNPLDEFVNFEFCSDCEQRE